MKKYSIIFIILVVSCLQLVTAEVKEIRIKSRELFVGGKIFGSTGTYEKITGRFLYAVDPSNRANKMIVDLDLAPINSDGKVEFIGDFIIIRPTDPDKGNHRILYDVNNRGNLYMLGLYNNARNSNNPSTEQHAGNGFLMEQGYTLVWTAWNWDVVESGNKLQIELPIATINGKEITQIIVAEIVVSFPPERNVYSQPLAWGGSKCYPPVDMIDKSEAVLSYRDEPRGKRTLVSSDDWEFADYSENTVIPDPAKLYIKNGYKSGKIYELVFRAKNPRVVGLGLAAIRDALSFLHFETKDKAGNLNPLAVLDANGNYKSDIEKVYIFGMSQSGRVINHMIFEGFHVDESDRMVFEGARIHVAGGGKGGFNHRFAQTTHHPSHLEGNYMPADFFPFNYSIQSDPVTGKRGDVLDVAKKLGKIPKIMITNNTLEYWTRAASLIHTDVEGKTDAKVHDRVRIYMVNGAPHGNGSSRSRGMYEHPGNTINHSPVLRALLVAMDEWVTQGIEPPESEYPRIDNNEMLSSTDHKMNFPKIPGLRHPGRNLKPPRVNYGDRFWTEGIFDVVPPEMGEPFQTLVPNFDENGNGIGGIRLPELTVPLATYQAFNPRRKEYGAPEYLGRFAGSCWVFSSTKEERINSGDPRLSIEERYNSKEEYVNLINDVVEDLIEKRLMMPEDGEVYKRNAGNMLWPPVPIQRYPFWKMKE